MAETPIAQPGSPAGSPPAAASSPVVVKKYANRRLYNTETSSYITLDNLAEMIRAGRDFVVYDAKSGEDITRGVLTQIIVEEESKGSSMLPTAFLRQLIGFYGGNLQGVVPRYLEHAMSAFARQQQQMRHMMQQTLSPFLPAGVEEMSRKNMDMFERAMSMWNPFHREGGAEAASSEPEPKAETQPAALAAPASALSDSERAELERLRAEVASLRQQLTVAHADAVVPPPLPVASELPENVLADAPAVPGVQEDVEASAANANGAARPRKDRPARPRPAGVTAS